MVVGFGFKFAMGGDGHEAAKALGGLLAGVTVSGVLLALFQANSGGAWDNAKKMFEEGKGVEVDGVYHTKGSDAHKAGVVGDTVGDPLKDTSGPSLNILLKLMTVIALVIAPLLVAESDSADNGKNNKAQNTEQNGASNLSAEDPQPKPGENEKPDALRDTTNPNSEAKSGNSNDPNTDPPPVKKSGGDGGK